MSILNVSPDTLLRPDSADDAGRLFAVVDANRDYLRQWLPWLDGSRSEADTLAFVVRALKEEEEGRGITRLIEFQGAIAGVVGFHGMNVLNRNSEIGYWLAEECQGRGIMTACVERLVRYAFEERAFHRVAIHVAVDNAKSRAIPERLGIQIEGVMREAGWLYDHYVDLVLYALVRSDGEGPRTA
jgi:ribosomal-protein-serine acetyltransferase